MLGMRWGKVRGPPLGKLLGDLRVVVRAAERLFPKLMEGLRDVVRIGMVGPVEPVDGAKR